MGNEESQEGPHSDERWALIPTCSILGRPIILGLMPLEGYPRPGMSCYRSLLCEKEERDCWFARPMESKVIPFDYEGAERLVLNAGRSFPWGLNPVPLVIESSLPPSLKAQLLQEFLDHTEELSALANYAPEDIVAALKTIA
ncbi:MAG: hypothetical protein FJ291_20505 [Planctomycetes bacterium]|nr:hypothetical protein [Planctomycetota bacterium]